MFRRLNRRPFVRRLGDPLVPLLIGGLTVLSPNISLAADILRSGAATTSAAAGATAPASVLPAATPSLTTSQDRLARTTQALQAVQQMQAAARALAQSGPNNLRTNLPVVPVNSYGAVNGLVVALGVPKDLANPAAGENPALWTGASLPVATTQGNTGAPTSTVTITQNQQQAVLTWDSFNIGKSTTLTFDQSAGGADIGQWIAFNKIGVTGSPSQILGSIQAGGQVYVINPNGIIFGGSAQVNAHALVASSLPINDNLIARGLLNNPDDQFLFSTLPIASGSNGTPAFTPTVSDAFVISGAETTYMLARNLAAGATPVVSVSTPGAGMSTLIAGTDYTVGPPGASGRTTLTFSATGLQKISAGTANVSYQPAGDQYGDVIVQAGAQLIAPTSADHVGGRIALVGPNVTNAGTISTADGQTILAAGLQVGMAAHASTDASLRGLDVYVGAVQDPSLNIADANGAVIGNTGLTTGTVTNASLATSDIGSEPSLLDTAATNPGGLDGLGLIEAPRGDVFMTGQSVRQLGFVDSSTSVSYDGRVDLVASYNAVSSRGAANAPPFFMQNTGSVALGAGSSTRILPESDPTATVVGTTLTLPSQINISGQTVLFAGAETAGSGATVVAPGATVTVQAGSWHYTLGGIDPKTGFPIAGTTAKFIYDSGQIALGSGAAIDVSGSQDVSASVAENIVSVQLRGPELANSPLQRDGPLRGQTVQVDLRESGTYNGTPWVGTPLADTSGYVGLVQRTAQELTVDGGSVSLNAGDAVVANPGSAINVSGGWINYQGAAIQTTKLGTANGHVVDISQATPDQVYTGIYSGTTTRTDPKWGTTQSTSNPIMLTTYDPGYKQGGSGGTLAITAPAMTLTGNLSGQTFAGIHQNHVFVPYDSTELQSVIAAGIDPKIWELNSLPSSATLALTFAKQYLIPGATNNYASYLRSAPDIYLVPTGGSSPLSPHALVLSTTLIDSSGGGFGNLAIDVSADNYQKDNNGLLVLPIDPATGDPSPVRFGSITVQANPGDPDNIAMRMTPGGSLTLDASNITVNGGIVAPGGRLNLTAHNFWQNSPYNANSFGLPAYDSTRGNLLVAQGVVLNVAGQTVDERAVDYSSGVQALLINGGAISLAGSNVTLNSGSILNANGGAAILPTARVAYGSGGSINLKAGADPRFGGGAILGGRLTFDVSGQQGLDVPEAERPLQGFGGTTGGTLSITVPLIQIGEDPGAILPTDMLQLSPAFFNAGGFAGFSLTGQGRAATDSLGLPVLDNAGEPVYVPAVSVTAATIIAPRVSQTQITVAPSGFQSEIVAPPLYQNTPVNLQFGATGVTDNSAGKTGFNALIARGDVVVGDGALIWSDPKGTISLSGQTVTVLGSVVSPGGTIKVNGAVNSIPLFANSATPLPTVDLGPNSLLSTAGTTVLTGDPLGRAPGAFGYLESGSVLPGGSIVVSGNTVAEAGSAMDVSGWSDANDPGGLVYSFPSLTGQSVAVGTVPQKLDLVPTLVETNGGTISIIGGDEFFLDANLSGAAGGKSAAGGSLSLAVLQISSVSPIQTALIVSQDSPAIPKPFSANGRTAIGQPVVEQSGDIRDSAGYFAADSFLKGGFDNLALNGNVAFTGPVAITAKGSLTVGTGGIISAGEAVTLSAGYVALGQPYRPPPQISNPFLEYNPLPSFGNGSLSVVAGSVDRPGLIDVGNLSLQGIGQTSLASTNGDVRGYGLLDVAGNVSLTAAQVYPVTAETFTVAAYGYHLPGDKLTDPLHDGSVSLAAAGNREAPLSAGGTLNVYAARIDQGGVLRAPIGTINLGWDGTGTAPFDSIANVAFPATAQLDLEKGSVTSVAADVRDAITGTTIPIPYGLSLDGSNWIDPTGADISSLGPPEKQINLSGTTVEVGNGAVVNLSGGGDLYAFEFVRGSGGTVDLLGPTSSSFAVLPGYQAGFAPDASFSTTASTATFTNLLLGIDLGYTSVTSTGANRLAVGDQVHIDLGNGLGPRDYTLLPARYALLPGAYLVSPINGTPASARPVLQPDGSSVAVGYRTNFFDSSQPLYGEFAVAPESVVRTRAQYADFSADSFFSSNQGPNLPRLPVDGGQLVLEASRALTLQGSVSAMGAAGGRGGLADIASPGDVVINDTGDGPATSTLYLSSADLSTFGADSLLIGGTRTTGSSGTTVNVTANNLTVDNSGQVLSGPEIILAANNSLTLAPGAEVMAIGKLSGPADSLQVADSIQLQPATNGFLNLSKGGAPVKFPLGTPAGDTITATVAGTITLADGTTKALAANKATTLAAGSTITLLGAGRLTSAGTGGAVSVTLGDGTLLRVSTSADATISRSAIVSSTAPVFQVGAGASINGASVILDSTFATHLDPTAAVTGGLVSFDSGQISLVIDQTQSTTPAPNSLILSGAALHTLQTGVTGLSLLSYSSIDIFGAGQIGTVAFNSLAFHAGEIRGFDLGPLGQVTLAAKSVSLDNSPSGGVPGVAVGSSPVGTLAVEAGTITLGTGQLAVDQFANLQLNATDGILVKDSGGLTTPGTLSMVTPVLTGAAGARQVIVAGGALSVGSPTAAKAAVAGGMGANLTLSGSSVDLTSAIAMAAGSVELHATGSVPVGAQAAPDVTVSGSVDVGGSAQNLGSGLTGFVDAGSVALVSDNGSVVLSPGASINVSAQNGGGNAGSVAVMAPNGFFNIATATSVSPAPSFLARNGSGGNFTLDASGLSVAGGASSTSLSALEAALSAGNFINEQNLRVRKGDVTIDGLVTAKTFNLSSDEGSIDVSALGFIDASGPTGGAINLSASGSIILESGARLSVRGDNFDNAGKGGTVTLEAGSRSGGNSSAGGARDSNGAFGPGIAAVDIRTGSTIDLSVANNRVFQLNRGGSTIALPVAGLAIYFPSGTPGNDEVGFTAAGEIRNAAGTVTGFTASADNPFVTALAPGSTVTLVNAGTVTFATGSGGSIPLALPSRLPDGTALAVTNTNITDLTAYNSSGILHLRAPQVLDAGGRPVDVQVNPINGKIISPSAVVVEGYQVFDLTGTGGLITDSSTATASQPSGGIVSDPNINLRSSVEDNGALFAGGILSDGTMTVGHTASITAQLLAGNPDAAGLGTVFHLRPGAEIVNGAGDLTLPSTWDFAAGAYYNYTGNPAIASNWDLTAMAFRFGPSQEPGFLTLRAKGNIVLATDPNNDDAPASISDGFGTYDGFDNGSLWTSVLLPPGTKTWSYRLVAGADLSAADSRQVLPLVALVPGTGSVLLGEGVAGLAPTVVHGTDLQSIVPKYFQTIRTGAGDIDIYAGRDVQILNNLATIYTAGTQQVPMDEFDLPVNEYPAQYAAGGGNVLIMAQGDIAHLGANGTPDSSKELPMNWLNRRGWVDSAGQFASPRDDDTVDSLSWWIDYTNFFEGVGALGGGNVSLRAGHDIANLDAVVPTNERTSKQTTLLTADGVTVDTAAVDQATLELGGGDLSVQSGNDISGGVYYVERGNGSLVAGGSIHSNSTRTTLAQQQLGLFPKIVGNSNSWLPTTVFLGNGNFVVGAKSDVVLGAVANPFLLPQSRTNVTLAGQSNDESTYFSTYAMSDSVTISSLTGAITLKDHPDVNKAISGGSGSLLDWIALNLMSNGSPVATTAYTSQPWLSLYETDILPFTTVAGLMPASLRATTFGGDINLVGGITLSPSAGGQLALQATGSINGVQPNAVNMQSGAEAWASSMLNLSDADPFRIPGVSQPLGLSFSAITSVQRTFWADPGLTTLPNVDALFGDSGSSTGSFGVIQTKRALHAPGPLHASDPDPVILFAQDGDISGLTLFAGKSARVVAGRDVTDVALYVQNNQPADVTTVAAGRDIIPYDPNSALRINVQASGQQFFNATSATSIPATGTPAAGDIQIGGPGTLEVLAGRNLILGVGPGAADGTSVGIKSIGNTRNPALPFGGAQIVAVAGIGAAAGLDASQLDFDSFINTFLNPATAGAESAVNLPDLGTLLGIAVDPKNPQGGDAQVWSAFSGLSSRQQDQLALDVFYLVLRNAGRNHNNSDSAGFGNYNDGYKAVATLFGRGLDYSNSAGTGFIDRYLNLSTAGGQAEVYLPALGRLLGMSGESNQQIFDQFSQLPTDQQHQLALNIFSEVLDDAARKLTSLSTNADGKAQVAQALASLFNGQLWQGDISLATREIESTNGGDVSLLAPGGSITVGRPSDPQKPDQGVLTAHGGNISIFADDSVNVGTSRIFTLRGGNEVIWSSTGNIAAGSGSKTVFSAPPTRVLIDPQSGNVQNDLAGLATGSGIGVLATLAGVPPGDVDLIAPVGTVDAGDAGIRSSGNLNIAAAIVLNASNIQVGGTAVGTPPPPPAPNLGSLTAASSASAATSSAATDVAKQNSGAQQMTELPSLISVEVLGYGGDDENSPDASQDPDDDKRKKKPPSN